MTEFCISFLGCALPQDYFMHPMMLGPVWFKDLSVLLLLSFILAEGYGCIMFKALNSAEAPQFCHCRHFPILNYIGYVQST